ncbi:unnamed protein product [Fusarium graminearum]|nr:unnamed protein product [Fusarium graminearum]VTO93934.1 unnamed protein product [Fusarium graminearum]
MADSRSKIATRLIVVTTHQGKGREFRNGIYLSPIQDMAGYLGYFPDADSNASLCDLVALRSTSFWQEL